MTNPVNNSTSGTHSPSFSEGKPSSSSQGAAQRMADAVAVAAEQDRGFDVAFDGPDLTITGTNANDTILVRKQPDGTLRVQAEGRSGYYDILPDVREVTIDARGGDNEISVDPDIERPFTLIAGGGTNKLSGGAGDDTMIGNGSKNNLFGSRGNDKIYGNGQENYLRGGDGEDVLMGNGHLSFAIGRDGKSHVFEAGRGNFNDLEGNGGNDILHGGIEGANRLSPGPGAGSGPGPRDRPAFDFVYGGQGATNQILGGWGDAMLYGGDKDDEIQGGPGDDHIFGGAGNDRISGDDGHNKIEAGAGDDIVQHTNYMDTIYGGPGNDIVVLNPMPLEVVGKPTVIDSPDEGSAAHHHGDWWGANPAYFYEERKK